jgi:hypothetical protein
MQVKVFDILIEFKFVSLADAGLSGEEACGLSSDALKSIPALAAKMADAQFQVDQYGKSLNGKYGNLNLKCYAVVSLGFERIWWEETADPNILSTGNHSPSPPSGGGLGCGFKS